MLFSVSPGWIHPGWEFSGGMSVPAFPALELRSPGMVRDSAQSNRSRLGEGVLA
jgi:hypothetical protein